MGMGMYGYRGKGEAITGSELASYHFMLGLMIWARHLLGPDSAFMCYAGPDGMYVSFAQCGISGSLLDDADECRCGDLDEFRAGLERLGERRAEFPELYGIVFDRMWETLMDPRVTIVRVT